MPTKTLLLMIALQVVFKVVYEIIILPLTVCVTKKVQKYEDKLNL
jgi:hypothetical protein